MSLANLLWLRIDQNGNGTACGRKQDHVLSCKTHVVPASVANAIAIQKHNTKGVASASLFCRSVIGPKCSLLRVFHLGF